MIVNIESALAKVKDSNNILVTKITLEWKSQNKSSNINILRDKSKYDEIFNSLEQQNGKITGKLDHAKQNKD